jgi:hypothetical protein
MGVFGQIVPLDFLSLNLKEARKRGSMIVKREFEIGGRHRFWPLSLERLNSF